MVGWGVVGWLRAAPAVVVRELQRGSSRSPNMPE